MNISFFFAIALGNDYELQIIIDVTRCSEASKRGSSSGGRVPAKRVSRPASFRGGAKNDDVRSLAARLYHMTASGITSGVAARFNSDINPSGFIQDVGCWWRVVQFRVWIEI